MPVIVRLGFVAVTIISLLTFSAIASAEDKVVYRPIISNGAHSKINVVFFWSAVDDISKNRSSR